MAKEKKSELAELMEANRALKQTNELLCDLVDNYDKALTDLTAVQRTTTENLNRANKLIEGIVSEEEEYTY